MVEILSSDLPFKKVTLATSSAAKRRANETSIESVATMLGTGVDIDSVNPELYEDESDRPEVDHVAWLKTETLRKNVAFEEGERTILAAFDVVTLLGSEAELDEGKGEDLKRIMRDIDLSSDADATTKWDTISKALEVEQTRMLERCAHGAFAIEWHIGFAINSNDSKIANRAALVLRATFNALGEDIVLQAFTLSEDLKQKREHHELPTSAELTAGVQALAIGPRLPFAELLPQFAQTDKLTIRNRDYPDVDAMQADTETFLKLVKECALPPLACLDFLASSYDEAGTPESQLAKPTILVTHIT